MNEAQRRRAPEPIEAIRQRLGRLALVSRASLGWERLWPRLWLPAAVILTFLAVSWFGLWTHLPWQGRALGVLFFAGALAASLWHVARTRLPTHRDALTRLDQSLQGSHRPASALEDSLAVGSTDPVSQALWKLHVERQSRQVAGLSVAAPQPRMAGRDRFALRAVPLLAAVTALFVAGHEADPRLRAAFDWRGPPLQAPAIRIDAWIDPPGYTRLPPMLIDFARLNSPNLSAPEKSTIVVRIAGKTDMDVATTGRLDAIPASEPGAANRTAGADQPAVLEKRYTLSGNGTLRLTGSGSPHATLNLTAIADQPPRVRFSEPPKPVTGAQSGGLALHYTARDDYGVASVEVNVSRAGPASSGRSLVEPPKQALSVPSSPTSDEEVRSTVDFSAHPWAGAKVRMTLTARDEAGQEGRSEPVEVVLPQRTFTKPLAKALVEQRRKLVMDVDDRRKVQLAMDALLIEPETYMKETGVYLGMRLINERLRRAGGDDELREVAELMWAMALQLEDGDMSDAERALRQAQENLQQALERGASEEEIAKLTEEMRRAMEQFMRQLAEQMQRQQQNGDQNQAQLPENFRTVTPRDLQNMLNRIEELSKRGEMAEAQRLMEQLNQMLNNLQMARPGQQQQDQRSREMNQALGDLDRMTREQQDLRDETYQNEQRRQNRAQRGQRPGQQQGRPGQQGQRQQGQRGQQPGEQGQPGEEGENGEGMQGQNGQGLSQRQQALRERLEELQRRMRGMGAPQQGELGEAEDAMRDAEGQLGQGQGEGALDAQGRALDALRRGGQNLAQQMQGQPGEGEGTEGAYGEPDGRPAGRPSAEQRGREDPLGRPQRQRDWADGRVRVPGADESATQRARRILDELRRRLGDPSRPIEELDYLERLLRRN